MKILRCDVEEPVDLRRNLLGSILDVFLYIFSELHGSVPAKNPL